MSDPVLFAGPSTQGVPPALLAQGLDWRLPARRGDVDRLLEQTAKPGVMILCDGVFQAVPAVSHAEICRALDTGWKVWGVSSMGAIRAHEMRAEGVQGYGWVHAQFARHEDFTDDELCLLHLPESPWLAVTEPLVNLRYALDQRAEVLGISPAAQARLIAALRALWFGERSIERMREAMCGAAGISETSADSLLCWLQNNRIKAMDLAGLLTQRPWLT